MKFRKWTIKGKVYSLPFTWNKQQVLDFANFKFIQICEICNKIDVNLNHYNKHADNGR